MFKIADSARTCLFTRNFTPSLLVVVTMECVMGIGSLASSKNKSALKVFNLRGSPSYLAIDFLLQ